MADDVDDSNADPDSTTSDIDDDDPGMADINDDDPESDTDDTDMADDVDDSNADPDSTTSSGKRRRMDFIQILRDAAQELIIEMDWAYWKAAAKHRAWLNQIAQIQVDNNSIQTIFEIMMKTRVVEYMFRGKLYKEPFGTVSADRKVRDELAKKFEASLVGTDVKFPMWWHRLHD